MSSLPFGQQALNRAVREAVDFVHAEGWDAGPTLFGLVPAQLLDSYAELSDDSPLALVVQELPPHILPGSDELGDYLTRVRWPEAVVGAVLAQEITFRQQPEEEGADLDGSELDAPESRESHGDVLSPGDHPARLFSGVLAEGPELTLLQLRPTEEQLSERGPFAEDEIELRGGPNIAPGVIAALRYGFEESPEDFAY